MSHFLSNKFSKKYPLKQLYANVRLALFHLSIVGGALVSSELQANTVPPVADMPVLSTCHQINGKSGCTNSSGISTPVNNIRNFTNNKLDKTISADKNYVENIHVEPVQDPTKLPKKELVNEEELANTLSKIERLEQQVEQEQSKLENLNDELLSYQDKNPNIKQPQYEQDYPLIHSDFPQSEKKNEKTQQTEKQITADDIKSVALTKQLIKKSYNPTAYQYKKCQGQWVTPNVNTPKNNRAGNPTTDSEGNPLPKGGFYALADYGYYDNKERAELSGNVVVKQGKQLINAEKVTLDLVNKVAKADGKVLFTDSADLTKNPTRTNDNSNKKLLTAGIVGIADEVVYDTTNATANVSDIAFASTSMQAHGYAKKMKKVNDKKYQLKKVTFSTCQPKVVKKQPLKAKLFNKKQAVIDIANNQHSENAEKIQRNWQIDAGEINLDTDTGRAEAYNTTLRIRDVPVLYLPYFNFPIDERRTSGFLSPSTSLNTTTGLEIAVPYYFNLAPNYDATITSKIFTDRNPMVSGEFRYLTKNYGKGQLNGSFLAKDKRYQNKNRSSLFYQHDWQSKKIPNLSVEAQYNYVSDSKYKDDFDYLGVVDNELNLPRKIQANYFDKYIDAELKFENYQSLEATDINGKKIQDKDRPFDRLPQLNIHYKLPKLGKNLDNHLQNKPLTKSAINNLEITGEHDSAYFKQRIKDDSGVEKSGFRMYNSLNARYPIYNSWGKITPSVNLQHLFSRYDEDARLANNVGKKDNKQSVFVPQFNLDTEVSFVKRGSPFNINKDAGGYQILSPRLKYSYAPYKKQNDIPNFNTQIASLSYEQLFADSWFLGHDRLQDLHAVTPALNYRYIDNNGLTRLNASIAEQYYLDKGLVSLDDNSNSSTQSNRLFSEKSSGIVTSISTQPYKKLWLDIDGALTPDYDLNYITSQVRYQPTDTSQFSLGLIERKENKNINQLPISALTGSAIFPIKDKWRVLSQAQYDYDKNKFLDSLVGVDYEDCCLGFSIYGRHYYNNLQLNQKSNNAIMAELRLKGISSTGRLAKLLSNKIVGFKSINNYWNSKK